MKTKRGVHLFGSKSVKKKRVMQADQPINLRLGGGVKGRSSGLVLNPYLLAPATPLPLLLFPLPQMDLKVSAHMEDVPVSAPLRT